MNTNLQVTVIISVLLILGCFPLSPCVHAFSACATRSTILDVKIDGQGTWSYAYSNGAIDEVKVSNLARPVQLVTSDAGVTSVGTPTLKQLTFKEQDANPMYYPTWTRSSPYKILFCPWYEKGMKMIDPDTLDSHFLPNGMIYDGPADYSPDGSKIAFSRYTSGAYIDNIFVMNADGTNVKQLESSSNLNQSPSWSHDGSRIAWTKIVGSDFSIYVMNSDGTNPTYITEGASPRWSYDDNYLYFQKTVSGIAYVYKIDLTTKQETPITEGEFGDIAQDGRILFNLNNQAYMINSDGSGKQYLIDNAHELQWSPDASYISFVDDVRTGKQEVYIYGPISLGNTSGTYGNLKTFDLDYHGSAPNSDGNDQATITVNGGSGMNLFFYYKEGTASNSYIIRVIPEWDQNNVITRSDNGGGSPESEGKEAGGFRWGSGSYTAPSTPGTYKIRVVYASSQIPPTWSSYDRLLAEGNIVVLAPQTYTVISPPNYSLLIVASLTVISIITIYLIYRRQRRAVAQRLELKRKMEEEMRQKELKDKKIEAERIMRGVLDRLSSASEPVHIGSLANDLKTTEEKVRTIIDEGLKNRSLAGTYTNDRAKFITQNVLDDILRKQIK